MNTDDRRVMRTRRLLKQALIELTNEKSYEEITIRDITDQADIGNFENRHFLVLIDRHDCAGVLDTGQVLDGARDADRDVEIRTDSGSGLADLQAVGNPAQLHDGS